MAKAAKPKIGKKASAPFRAGPTIPSGDNVASPEAQLPPEGDVPQGMKRGGKVVKSDDSKKGYDNKGKSSKSPDKKEPKKFAKGGAVKRADGCAERGKTRGKFI